MDLLEHVCFTLTSCQCIEGVPEFLVTVEVVIVRDRIENIGIAHPVLRLGRGLGISLARTERVAMVEGRG